MSALTLDGDLVHYEVLGRGGRPVILLHGWIGSWRYWIPVMQQLYLKFRVYSIDLFGFGDSGKNEEKYTIEHQVRLLSEFMKKMGIPKVALIGHGLGAMVMVEFAKQNPDQVARILGVSLPLFDPGDLDERNPAGHSVLLTPPNQNTVADLVKANSNKLNQENATAAFHELPTIPSLTSENREEFQQRIQAVLGKDTIPSASAKATPATSELAPATTPATNTGTKNTLQTVFKSNDLTELLSKTYKRSEPEYEKLKVDVDKADDNVLKVTAEKFDAGKMLDDIRQLKMPIVIVHGADDPIIPSPTEQIWDYLTLDKDDQVFPIPLKSVRHFPMLEYEPFTRLASDFLSIPDLSKLEVKERWVRRTR